VYARKKYVFNQDIGHRNAGNMEGTMRHHKRRQISAAMTFNHETLLGVEHGPTATGSAKAIKSEQAPSRKSPGRCFIPTF